MKISKSPFPTLCRFLKYIANVEYIDNFARIFKEISRNILKKLKQFLKKFCVNLVQVKCEQLLIKIYPPFEENYGENVKAILRKYYKILMKY